MDPGLDETVFHDPPNFTFPFGAHGCEVEVDAETGKVEIKDYIAVDDCGRVVNPMIVDGQVHGGVAQSIGQALYEGAIYSDEGTLLNGYAGQLPGAVGGRDPARSRPTAPRRPRPSNPLGVKGIGEAGTIAATAGGGRRRLRRARRPRHRHAACSPSASGGR